MSLTRRARFAAVALPTALAAAVLAASAPAGAATPGLAAAPPTRTTAEVADDLVVPWDLAFLPDGRMAVTEREGRIRVYASGAPGAALERTLAVPSVRLKTADGITGEAGVMGIAVDTDFATSPYVYVCASRDYAGSNGWVNQVLRYTVRGTTWSAPTVIATGMKAGRTHNGCALEMDSTGHLWVGMGDSGVAGLAQNRSSLNGKILRMTRTGGVPADNPTIGGVKNLVYALGVRNPQGIALEPGTGRVYSVEHGPNRDDEINLLQAGGNYGWPCYVGDGVPNTTNGCKEAGAYLPPAWSSGVSTIATSGATFARGAQWQDDAGDLFVSVLKESQVRRFDVSDTGALAAPETLYDGTFGRLRASVVGPGGRLYLTTSNGNDSVVRVSTSSTRATRIPGSDRYDLAARVSAATYPAGAKEVIVATGQVFPDALTGSAAAGRTGMPVLLTLGDTLPAATRAELERLKPTTIHVLGGTGSVSAAVQTELEGLASGGVDRISGPDRYAVAVGVSHAFNASGADTVFVASGEVFADALSAGPAAASLDAPLLLVRRDAVPTATVEEIKRLAPKQVYVIGGPGTISEATLAALRQATAAPIQRIAGANRYAVARSVAQQFWPTTSLRAYVASGEVFADGLAGGAAAGHRGAPLLLTASAQVPAATGQELLRMVPTDLTVLGGTGTVQAPVLQTFERLVGAP